MSTAAINNDKVRVVLMESGAVMDGHGDRRSGGQRDRPVTTRSAAARPVRHGHGRGWQCDHCDCGDCHSARAVTAHYHDVVASVRGLWVVVVSPFVGGCRRVLSRSPTCCRSLFEFQSAQWETYLCRGAFSACQRTWLTPCGKTSAS